MPYEKIPVGNPDDRTSPPEPTPARRSPVPRLLTVGLLFSLCLFFGIRLCTAPTVPFSEEENRTLAGAPDFSFRSLADGSFTKKLAVFCSDQFPLRRVFILTKTTCERLLGRRENNRVLIGQDGYLIPRQEYPASADAVLRDNLACAAAFRDAVERQGVPVRTVIVPRSIDVNREKLPAIYDTAAAYRVWQTLAAVTDELSFPAVTVTDALREAALAGEQVYYRTDHHFTTRGAYFTYLAVADVLGFSPFPESDFHKEIVSENFHGTSASSSGMFYVTGDAITLWRYDGDENKVTEILGRDGQSVVATIDGLYDFSRLDGKDQYSVFLGGTNALIRVRDTARNDLPTLVLIKDSFAQSVAPFLSRHYDLLLIDPRSSAVRSHSPLPLVENAEASAVLLLFGIDTLASGENLSALGVKS